MSNASASFDPVERRAAVRRTVWVMAGVAFTVFALFILKTYWH